MNTKTRLLLSEFGKKLKMNISSNREVIIMTTTSGREYWLEIPNKSPLLVIHTTLIENAAAHANISEMTKWLSINTCTDTMKGAWIGTHAETNSVKLCVALPVDFTSVEILEMAFKNLMDLAENFLKNSNNAGKHIQSN